MGRGGGPKKRGIGSGTFLEQEGWGGRRIRRRGGDWSGHINKIHHTHLKHNHAGMRGRTSQGMK